MADFGTRVRQGHQDARPPQGSLTRGVTRDNGIAKRVAASLTFTASNGRATGANGTFTGTFAVGDLALVQGARLNNGTFQVTGLDATNAAYLVLDPPPKDEGPLAVTVRTP